MKKFLLSIPLLALAVSAHAVVPNIYAPAFTATLDKSDVICSYKLNTEATEGVTIEVLRGEEVVATYAENLPAAKGENSCTLPLPAGLSGQFTVRLTVKAASTADQTEVWASPLASNNLFTASQSDDLFSWSRARGIAVDNDPESPFYGNMYVVGTVGSGRTTANNFSGIFIYDYLLNRTPATVGYSGGIAYTGNSSPLRATIDENHNLVICDWTSGTRAAAVMNTANPEHNFDLLLKGTVDGVTTNTAISSATITGTGEDRVLWTIDEAYGGSRGVLGYKIGESTSPWPGAPNYDFDNLGGLLKDETGCIISDKNGGLWVSQCTKPFIMHMTYDGTVDYQSASDLIDTTNKGAITTNNDGSKLLVGTTTEVVVFDVDFGEEISLTKAAAVSVLPLINNIWSVAIDGAENIYAVAQTLNNEDKTRPNGIAIAALPKEDNSYAAERTIDIQIPTGAELTAAPSEFSFRNGVVTSSEPAFIYTPSGVCVATGTTIDTNSFAPGIYIVKAGDKTLKIAK